MAVLVLTGKPRFLDKDALLARLEESDKETGFVPVPGATAQKSREASARRLIDLGISPEDVVYPQDSDKMEQ